MKRSEVKKIVEKAFHKSTSAGYRKLHKMADGYAGLSKHQVLKIASTNEKIRKFNVKFTNKAKLHPVIIKHMNNTKQTWLT